MIGYERRNANRCGRRRCCSGRCWRGVSV